MSANTGKERNRNEAGCTTTTSENGQQALDQYTQALQHLEDLFPMTWCNYLSDLRQFMA